MNEINVKICKMFQEYVVIDLMQVVARIGINSAYSNTNKYRWNSPYSENLYTEVVKDIYIQYLANREVKYKCIVLDCDNVLWGGIVSESNHKGIELSSVGEGKRYKEFQELLYCLYKQGILLAILSKNDKEDVVDVFKNHSDMVLSEEHISCFEVSWNMKAEGMIKIAQFLHIGLDSIIFIDDSAFEINQMKTYCPDVTAIQFDLQTIYQKLSIINMKPYDDLKQSELRNANIKADIHRKKVELESKTYAEYLNTINTCVDIRIANKFEYQRISELSQRVNRVTNGKRYSYYELEQLPHDCKIYSIYAKDIFGDLGLIGAIVIYYNSLLLFCVSCRALGRNIENLMIDYIKDNELVDTCYIKNTTKNNNIKNILNNITTDMIYVGDNTEE